MTKVEAANIRAVIREARVGYKNHPFIMDDPEARIEFIEDLLLWEGYGEVHQGLFFLWARQNPAWDLWLLEMPVLFNDRALLGALYLARKGGYFARCMREKGMVVIIRSSRIVYHEHQPKKRPVPTCMLCGPRWAYLLRERFTEITEVYAFSDQHRAAHIEEARAFFLAPENHL